jgi:hypothetical protein
MLKYDSFSNNSNHNENNQYEKCLGKNCAKDGTHFLSCSTIYKIGLFCDSCRKDLEECGLVDSPYAETPYQADLLRWM